MIGIVVQLLLSWMALQLIERKNLSVLGLKPTRYRMKMFVLFFAVTALLSASDYFLKIIIAQQSWVLSESINVHTIASGVWWNIKSVLFEELLFRGALFYILLKRTGSLAAVVISSAAFGIYHWYSYEIIGNGTAMAMTFLTTGLMGAVYAYGFVKTQSLYVPVAIHLGWNIVRSVVFSDTVIGEQLFVEVKPAPVIQVSYFEYSILVSAAFLSAIVINSIMLRKLKQQVIQ
jgi:hypothetical protein